MRIAVCGLSSSGKSTLSRFIAERFNLSLYSSGKIFRDVAEEKKMSLEELSKKADVSLDRTIDERTMKICREEDNFVIEGRLVCLFCKDAFKIYLYASLPDRARRMAMRENISYEDAYRIIKERDEHDLMRYRNLYGIEDYDLTMKKKADLVIDTSKHGIEEMCKIAEEKIKNTI